MLENSKQLLLQKLQAWQNTLLRYYDTLPFPKEHLIKNIFIFFIGTLGIAVFFQFASLFLPSSGVHYQDKSLFVARHLYRLGDVFYETEAAPSAVSTQTAQKSYTPFKGWSVQAMFSEGDIGFIVVLVGGSTHFINIGDSYDGYKLIKIQNKQAILLRDGKEYSLSLTVKGRALIEEEVTQAAPAVEVDLTKLDEGIVMRKDINTFVQDPKLIWDNIKIRPYNVAGKFSGFLVHFVKKGSVFDHLGLKTGDIIESANGIVFTSIQEAEDLYAHLDKIDNVSITVHRQGKIEELKYEIQ